ncbi:MAG: hypothetical protein Ct9H90mP16_00770 [Candidatus Poseidoniales archaeon]|nr:MAG: hypothetical protein Ct9H90mP16_00770 [Candidatus Poseidoniales archaeon]
MDISNQYNSLYRNDGDVDGDGMIDFTDVADEFGISGANKSSGYARGGNKTMGVALADFEMMGPRFSLWVTPKALPSCGVILRSRTVLEGGSRSDCKVPRAALILRHWLHR